MIKNKYNLIVIGGGPAGMMASGRAGELGNSVLLLEKNKKLGLKLLITGNGRCNLTNAEKDLKIFINNYGKNGRFLYSAFNKFSNISLIDFFEKFGLKTKIEKAGKVFPVSDKSSDVLVCLEKFLKNNKVEIEYDACVEKIIFQNKKIEKVCLKNGKEFSADNFLLATGGKSYPLTGSSGDAYDWLIKMGHKIITPKPVLTPIILKEKFIKKLEGVSLKNIELSLWNNRKISSCFGEAIFTANGLSGPCAFVLSKKISENDFKSLKIKIDFKPDFSYDELDREILNYFSQEKNKQLKNSLKIFFPSKLIPVILELAEIKSEMTSEVSKIERKKILKFLKEFEFCVQGLAGFDKAIVTAGGVDLGEVDPQTMKSKIIDNLYFAGEILDLDGPSEGYNLQVAWSTGYLAGDKKFFKK